METTSTQESAQWQLREKGARFLDFLSSVAQNTVKPQRTLTSSECFLSTDLPTVPGTILIGASETRTAWLTVKAVARPKPATVPLELREYINQSTIRSVKSTPKLGSSYTSLKEREHSLRLSSSPRDHAEADDIQTQIKRINTLFFNWKNRVWEPWKRENTPQEKAFDFYRKLFKIYQSLDQDPDSQELLFGHCVLTWNGRNRLSYPLVITPAHMIFKEDTGDIVIERADTTQMVISPADGTDLLGYPLLEKLQETFNDNPVDVWNDEELHILEEKIVTQLGPEATIQTNMDLRPTDVPVLHQGWTLFLRKRADNRNLFYRSLARKLENSEYLPVAFSTLFCDTKTLNAAIANRPADDGTADRPLLPLPANAEQERIIKQLASCDEVTVQGPPGTGKSHTIVNLICHLLAQGKRILVTAEKEQALAVLQNKIPEQIRDLTVAAIGTSAADNEHLRLSVQKMQTSLSNLSTYSANRRISHLEHNVDKARRKLNNINETLVEKLSIEVSRFTTSEGEKSAAEVAQWLSDNAHRNHIPDTIDSDAEPPLTVEEFTEFVTLCSTINPSDESACLLNLPDLNQLPTGNELSELLTNLHNLNQKITHPGVLSSNSGK